MKTWKGRTTSPGRRTRVPRYAPSDTFIEWQSVRARALLIAGLLLLAAAAIAPVALADNGGFAPVAPKSPNAEGIRTSFVFVSIFLLGIFLLVEGLLVVFIVRYRRRKRGRFEEGAPVSGATNLELAWTALPVVIL